MKDGMSDMKNISDNCFTDDGSIQKIKDGVKTIFHNCLCRRKRTAEWREYGSV